MNMTDVHYAIGQLKQARTASSLPRLMDCVQRALDALERVVETDAVLWDDDPGEDEVPW